MVMNFPPRDRKTASTPDVNMEDDQNGYCVLLMLLLSELLCFVLWSMFVRMHFKCVFFYSTGQI